MIISQTPLRISFVGGGTDFEDFYKQYPGRVLSTSIDKYIYLAINPKFDGQIRVSYSKTENIPHRNYIQHSIVKAILEETGIEKGVEIISVADIPSQGTGLGSSSSFTVGLLAAVHSYLKQEVSVHELAKKACQIEINNLGSPIGKQDHYAAAFGGLNIITFNLNGTVKVTPLNILPKIKEDFQNHLLMFYTGIQRSAQPILQEQRKNINGKLEHLKKMSDMVLVFKAALEKGDFKEAGLILHQNWVIKKELASDISKPELDQMYETALRAGAFGGKILGAGGGGFMLLVAPPSSHKKIKESLKGYMAFPFKFSEAGNKIIFKS